MSLLEKTLLAGEEPVYTARKHWIVFFWPVLIALFFGLLAFGEGLASHSPISRRHGTARSYAQVAAMFLAIAALSMLFGFVNKLSATLTITNRRVLAHQGVFVRRSFEVPLSWLATITVEESLVGRVLGYGTIVVRGTAPGQERFTRMASPLKFKRLVQDRWQRSQERPQFASRIPQL